MKKTLLIAAIIALLLPSAALAQTANGTLTVTATVKGSIGLVFNTGTGGVALTGTGTSAATLAFGNVSAFGTVGANITRTVNGTTDFTVSTPMDVMVTKANSASAGFTLTAQLGSADAVNTWAFKGVTVTNGAAASIEPNGTYGSAVTGALALTIPQTTAADTVISNTMNFVATAK